MRSTPTVVAAVNLEFPEENLHESEEKPEISSSSDGESPTAPTVKITALHL